MIGFLWARGRLGHTPKLERAFRSEESYTLWNQTWEIPHPLNAQCHKTVFWEKDTIGHTRSCHFPLVFCCLLYVASTRSALTHFTCCPPPILSRRWLHGKHHVNIDTRTWVATTSTLQTASRCANSNASGSHPREVCRHENCPALSNGVRSTKLTARAPCYNGEKRLLYFSVNGKTKRD